MVIFRERLWPSPWLTISGLLIVPAVFLVFAPISLTLAIPLSIGAYVLFLLFLLATSPHITVTETALQAGRASVSRDFIASVERQSRASTRELLTTRADARAYLMVRSWIPESVMVTLNDGNDPTPYWLLSSRRSEQLTEALATNPSE